jgi:hypothetical protein
MLSRIRSVLQVADQLRVAPMEIPSDAPIVLEDRGSLHKLQYYIRVVGLKSGLMLLLQINEAKRTVLLRDSFSVPLRIPSPLGWLGATIVVERELSESDQVRFRLKVSLRLGILGGYTLVDRSLQYSSSVEIPDPLPEVTDAFIRVVLGLARTAGPSVLISADQFRVVLDSLGLDAAQQSLYEALLVSQIPLDINYEVLKNIPKDDLLTSILDLLPNDQSPSFSTLQYLYHTCEQLGLDPLLDLPAKFQLQPFPVPTSPTIQ